MQDPLSGLKRVRETLGQVRNCSHPTVQKVDRLVKEDPLLRPLWSLDTLVFYSFFREELMHAIAACESHCKR